MADTSNLIKVTKYILKVLEGEFKTSFSNKKIRVGSQGVEKKFSGVSDDSKIIVHICHHSGRTKSGNIPVGKLNGLYSKCYIMEKANADRKYIYFTNREFYEIFRRNSIGIVDGIELRYFDNLPIEYQEVLNQVIEDASDEMFVG
ncbi:hypothetical protein [Desulfoscipio gibsoniae]|uniref:Restriction endonuclease type IV Mrr domain-containing protein n=1 Tax=Desulfoscipio gibsoniae DSM 7213 TaxID=767817 RepID=R4KJN3_9FIRM|nr:hypothetical protein [Desulfoscipio gibsoniae]AGK99840.1 hypothetical protein Desgi_0244 [Desulfoscipio gibsoniae DSM 7213]